MAVSLSMTGIICARGLKIRLLTLNSVLLFISLLQNELSFTFSPLGTAIENAAECPSLYLLDFLGECRLIISQGADFPDAWSKALSESRTLLKKHERNQLVDMCLALSRSDAQGQKRIFDYYRDYFTVTAQKAQSDKQKYTGLISVAGVLISALAAVILI